MNLAAIRHRVIDKAWMETRLEALVRFALVVAAAGTGLGYTFGSNAASTGVGSAFTFVNNLGLPFRTYGVLYLITAVMIAMPFRIRLFGYALGALLCTFLGVSFFLSWRAGHTAASAPSYQAALAVVHIAAALEYLQVSIERRVRAANPDASSGISGLELGDGRRLPDVVVSPRSGRWSDLAGPLTVQSEEDRAGGAAVGGREDVEAGS